MDKLKTFFNYFLLLAGFFIILNVLENGLVESMYAEVPGVVESDERLSIEVSNSQASNVNGHMDIKFKNELDKELEEAYAKIDLIDEYNLVATTEYVTISDLPAGEAKDYKIKYEGNSIKTYNVAIVDEIPDKSNIINILGWEIDKENVFGTGLDLTKINIFGINIGDKASELFGAAKKYGKAGWSFFLNFARIVPPWAYFVATILILSYM